MRVATSSTEDAEWPPARWMRASVLGPPKLVERRRLEQKVEGLQKLPARTDAVESQILQLRDEMRVEFSAIREWLGNHDRQFEAIDRRFQVVNERFDSIDHRFDETNRHMRVLHEEVLTRLSLLQEDRPRRKR